jgi:S-methylmethionine-dependent homocysteine/selenocysteine methylase
MVSYEYEELNEVKAEQNVAKSERPSSEILMGFCCKSQVADINKLMEVLEAISRAPLKTV